MDRYEEIKQLIEKNREFIDFADFGHGASEEVIRMAEERLEVLFPPSYKWWLMNYGGGTVYGEEIFSVYGPESFDMPSGDIVYINELNRKQGLFSDQMLVICDSGDFTFYYDLSKKMPDGEMPIYFDGCDTVYANDFIHFLKRRIIEC